MTNFNFNYQMLFAPSWEDYELVDSGNRKRLERLGKYLFVRPDPQCLWSPSNGEFEKADAVFDKSNGGKGWNFRNRVPEKWEANWNSIRFFAKATPSGYFGIFPEHSVHWQWMTQKIEKSSQPKILSLFGYTGLASLELARRGAHVTHVDASRPTIAWARENQALSGLSDKPIRWIVEDAMTYIEREIKRGNKYDGIVLDPPEYGRGPKGEIWKIEDSLCDLIEGCQKLLSSTPVFLLLSVYATNLSATTLHHLVSDSFKDRGGNIEIGELFNIETKRNRPVSESLFVRWSR